MKKGNYECLTWALKNGCPRNDMKICEVEITNGHKECFELALEHGCPWDGRKRSSSLMSDSSDNGE